MSGTSKITGREVERALKALTGCYLHKSGQGSTWYRCTCKDVADFCGITKPTARKYINMLIDADLVGALSDRWYGWQGMTYVWYGNMLTEPVAGSHSEGL